MIFNVITFGILVAIAGFHIYMGLGGPLNMDTVLPKIKGKSLPFHQLAALPVAVLLAACAIAFAQKTQLIQSNYPIKFIDLFLLLCGIAFLSRGVLGFIFFHFLDLIIDPTPFKTWDLRLYSPLTIYLGSHCLIILI
ncbi:MAG: DUF3995 domain-containing protein [Candidatus Margulisiibacteriota bacterium]